MEALGFFVKESVGRHASQDHCAFNHPLCDDKLLRRSKGYFLTTYHSAKNRLSCLLQVTHPTLIAALADRFRHNLWRLSFPSLRLPKSVCAYRPQKSIVPLELPYYSHQPLRPYMFPRIDLSTTKDASFSHWRLEYEEEIENKEGYRYPPPETEVVEILL